MKNLVISLFQPLQNFIKYFHGNFLWHSTPNGAIKWYSVQGWIFNLACDLWASLWQLNSGFSGSRMKWLTLGTIYLLLGHKRKGKRKKKGKSCVTGIFACIWFSERFSWWWGSDSKTLYPFYHIIFLLFFALHHRWTLAVFHGLNAHLQAACISLTIQTHLLDYINKKRI